MDLGDPVIFYLQNLQLEHLHEARKRLFEAKKLLEENLVLVEEAICDVIAEMNP